ncbi:MAG: NADPH:quinone reductase [Actinobacteria bacterium]|jgi:NADPH2:quinone reductase|nr:NADPH:quinone reductase [Actinomycetota bacterium]
MLAAIYERTGAAEEVLRVVTLPDPTPEAGEVRVRVRVSGINPTDWKARAPGSRLEVDGGDGLVWPYQIPGQDGAGVIDGVGRDVDAGRVGERVWVHLAAAGRPQGTAAGYVCVPAERALPLPDDVSFAEGAALGIPYVTAHRCLHADRDPAGASVLVTGGAGAVGNAAVQLARLAGARVIATVSSPGKAELAAAAGADVVTNYREATFPAELRAAAPDGIQHVVDVAPTTNFPTYLPVLDQQALVTSYATEPRGVATLPHMAAMERNLLVRFVLLYTLPAAVLDEAARAVNAALWAGELRALPARLLPLEHIAEAHDAVQAGPLGRILVEIP